MKYESVFGFVKPDKIITIKYDIPIMTTIGVKQLKGMEVNTPKVDLKINSPEIKNLRMEAK